MQATRCNRYSVPHGCLLAADRAIVCGDGIDDGVDIKATGAAMAASNVWRVYDWLGANVD